jgi:hypothetical protein
LVAPIRITRCVAIITSRSSRSHHCPATASCFATDVTRDVIPRIGIQEGSLATEGLDQSRLPRKRSRRLPGGALGVSPTLILPQDWGTKGVEGTFSALSKGEYMRLWIPTPVGMTLRVALIYATRYRATAGTRSACHPIASGSPHLQLENAGYFFGILPRRQFQRRHLYLGVHEVVFYPFLLKPVTYFLDHFRGLSLVVQ